MRRLVRLAIAASIAGTVLTLAISTLAVTHHIHADWYPSLRTYGVSVGTSRHYCYADLAGSRPSIGCETAR